MLIICSSINKMISESSRSSSFFCKISGSVRSFFLMSSLTISKLFDAIFRGVRPFSIRILGSAPLSSRSLTTFFIRLIIFKFISTSQSQSQFTNFSIFLGAILQCLQNLLEQQNVKEAIHRLRKD